MTVKTPVKGAESPRPGRPKQLSDEERRKHLIDAAEEVFLQKGYYAAKVDDIADRAGMSKKTIYQVFPAKEALFAALLDDRLSVLMLPFDEASGDPAAALEALMLKLALFVLSPKQIRLTRLMISEAARSPEMSRAVQRMGLGQGKGSLERWFAAQKMRGTLKIDDPVRAANTMFGLVIGDLQLFLLLNAAKSPSKDEIRNRVRESVAFFFRGIGHRPGVGHQPSAEHSALEPGRKPTLNS